MSSRSSSQQSLKKKEAAVTTKKKKGVNRVLFSRTQARAFALSPILSFFFIFASTICAPPIICTHLPSLPSTLTPLEIEPMTLNAIFLPPSLQHSLLWKLRPVLDDVGVALALFTPLRIKVREAFGYARPEGAALEEGMEGGRVHR